MAWGTKQTLTAVTGVNNTVRQYLDVVTLNPRELCQMQVIVDNEHASAVTDAVQLDFYGRVDNATAYDDVPFMTITHKPATVAAERVPVTIMGVREFRIGVLSLGATNTYTVSAEYVKDGVSA